jgi:putative ABC transport system permease protein
VEGRRFAPGVREVMVGRKAAGQFAGLTVGSRIAFRDSDWTVVGIFESGGDVHESEIWADAEVAVSAFRRQGFQSLTATLASPSSVGFANFVGLVGRDPRLAISVLREPEYYAKQAKVLSWLIEVLGYTVAVFMAVGATFGALNCMYTAIASRQVEIATLRAIGFGGLPVVVSVMIEALLLARWAAPGWWLAYLYWTARRCRHSTQHVLQVAFSFRQFIAGPGLHGHLPVEWWAVSAIRAARLPRRLRPRSVDVHVPSAQRATPPRGQPWKDGRRCGWQDFRGEALMSPALLEIIASATRDP